GGVPAPPEASELPAAGPLLPLPRPPRLEELLAQAARHPEVRAFARQQDAALARASRERAAIRPLPDLSLELEKLQGQPALGLRAGIAFDLPLLSWNSGRVHEAQAQAAAAAYLAHGALARRAADLRSARARWD